MLPVTEQQSTALEAAAFRRLITHLQERMDVQNIDLMNLAGFCRNCLARWLEEAAHDAGLPVDRDAARTHVYGMPAEEWKALHQREAPRPLGDRSSPPAEPRREAPGADSRQAEA